MSPPILRAEILRDRSGSSKHAVTHKPLLKQRSRGRQRKWKLLECPGKPPAGGKQPIPTTERKAPPGLTPTSPSHGVPIILPIQQNRSPRRPGKWHTGASDPVLANWPRIPTRSLPLNRQLAVEPHVQSAFLPVGYPAIVFPSRTSANSVMGIPLRRAVTSAMIDSAISGGEFPPR